MSDVEGVAIGGTVAAGYESVRDAFARNFAEHGEVGATYAVYVNGTRVVDLWGGVREEGSEAPYTGDTLQVVFSSTKGAAAACANLLAQRGLLDVEAPVAEYWPEFAQAGKAQVPVEHLLTHQVGLPTVDTPLAAEDVYAWDPLVDALAAQVPFWEPGTAHGYHAISYGNLVGEVVRRVDGRSIGTFFHEEFAEPLGLDFWIGLPEEQDARVAPMIGMNPGGPPLSELLGAENLLVRALTLQGAMPDLAMCANTREYRAAEIPAAGGVANARSLARLYAGLIGPVDGGPARALLTPEQVDTARICRTTGPDRVLSSMGMDMLTTIGLGFWTASPFAPMGGPRAFGHYGAGGSVGFADPESGIAAGYVMSKMGFGISDDPRSTALIRATYAAAGAPYAWS
jgi:CubicO group peptidase (beta-lactamase class C family)